MKKYFILILLCFDNSFLLNSQQIKSPLVSSYKEYISLKKNSLLLIGPEGDFTREEKEKIKGFKFKSITLGDQILRSETAAVVGGYMLSEF